MGERAPESAAVQRAPRRPGWKGWLLLGIALLVAVWAAWPRAEADALEVTNWMQARSVVGDLDRRWGPRDSARLEAWRREHRESVHPDPVIAPEGRADAFGAPLVPSLLLAPAAMTGRFGLALAWQALLVALGLGVALSALGRRLGRGASEVLGLLVLGSVAFPALFHLWPDTLVLALVTASFGLAWGAALPGPEQELADVYEGAWGESRGRFLTRWLGAGLLLGAAVASRGTLAPLVLGLLVPLPADRKRAASGLVLIGFFAPVAAEMAWRFAVGGSWWPGLPTFDPDLLRWAALDLAAGRHLGLVVCFAPLLLVLLSSSGRDGGWVPAVAGLLSMTALLLWSPHDLYGGPWALGNRLLLGVYPAFWFAMDRTPGRALRLAVWALAGAVIWPLWLAPRTVPGSAEAPSLVAPYLVPWLPVETTQRPLIENLPRVRAGGVEVIFPSGGAAPGPRAGEIVLDDGGSVELILRSDQPVIGLRLEAEEVAGVDVALRGAALRQTVFRPDGSTGFRIAFEGKGRVHPLERGGSELYFRRFEVAFPKAPARPLRVGVGGIEMALLSEGGAE